MSKTRVYYTLLSRETDELGSCWYPEFGDYSRAVVNDERQDYRDRGWKAKDLMILRTSSDLQAEIDAAIDVLNAE